MAAFTASAKAGSENCATVEGHVNTVAASRDSYESVSKRNFVVMDERSMTTFIFRVVQPREAFHVSRSFHWLGGLCSRRCALASRALPGQKVRGTLA